MEPVISKCRWSFSFYFLAQITLLALVLKEWFLYLLLGMALHESAHWTVMKLFRVPITQVSFSPAGIRFFHSRLLSPGKEALILLSGPVGNLLAFVILRPYFPEPAWIQAALGFYHLLPIQNLDGGSLWLLFFSLFLEPGTAQKACRLLSLVTCFCLFLAAAGCYAVGWCSLFIPVVTLGLVINEYKK